MLFRSSTLLSASSDFSPVFSTPSPALTGSLLCLQFSPSGNALVVGTIGSPYIIAFQWSNSGIGARYPSPSSSPGVPVHELRFTPSGDAIIVSTSNSSPYVFAYQWSDATGFGSRYDPPTSIPDYCIDLDVSPTSDVVAITTARTSENFMAAWQWSYSGGFGTKYPSPSSRDGNDYYRPIKFHPSGNYIAAGSRYRSVVALPWSYSTGFGPLISSFSPFSSDIFKLSWSPSGDALAFTTYSQATSLRAVRWTGSGWGTEYSPASYITTTLNNPGYDVKFFPSGNYLAFSSAYDRLLYYPWNSTTGFGQYSRPSPAGSPYQTNDLDIHPLGNAVAAISESPPYLFALRWP